MNNAVTTIYVIREHDKICLLENLMKNIESTSEKIVSAYIDNCIIGDSIQSNYYLKLLHSEIHDKRILSNILKVATSIVKQTPLKFNIENTDENSKLIEYFSKQQKQILPLF